jgi:hypothetical protein
VIVRKLARIMQQRIVKLAAEGFLGKIWLILRGSF